MHNLEGHILNENEEVEGQRLIHSLGVVPVCIQQHAKIHRLSAICVVLRSKMTSFDSNATAFYSLINTNSRLSKLSTALCRTGFAQYYGSLQSNDGQTYYLGYAYRPKTPVGYVSLRVITMISTSQCMALLLSSTFNVAFVRLPYL